MPEKNQKVMKKRCRAIKKSGERCTREAVIDGYCLLHWEISAGMLKRKVKGDWYGT